MSCCRSPCAGVSLFGALPVALLVRDHSTIATFSMVWSLGLGASWMGVGARSFGCAACAIVQGLSQMLHAPIICTLRG